MALVLLFAGIAFVAVELHAPGFGGPGTAAVVCFVVAGLLLVDDRTSMRIPQQVVVAAAVAGAIAVVIVTVFAVRTRSIPPHVPSRVLGKVGVVISDLDPIGNIRVLAEEWTAESPSERIEVGARVKVVGEHGLTLRVDRFSGED